MKHPLSPREIRGLIQITRNRPDYIRVVKRDYSDSEILKDKRVLGLISDIMSGLDLAIQYGDPNFYVEHCTRETAKNWGPK